MRTLALALSLSMPALAHAGPPGTVAPVGVEFINLADAYVSGQVFRPRGQWVDAKQRAHFERLLRLRRSVLPALRATATDRTFR